MKAVDKTDQGLRIGAADVDVGGENGQRLVPRRIRRFAADRPRQDHDCQAEHRQRGQCRRGPVAQRHCDPGDEQRRDRDVGSEGHHRHQRVTALEAKEADHGPDQDRYDRCPYPPVAAGTGSTQPAQPSG
jgi:hypothetical protein